MSPAVLSHIVWRKSSRSGSGQNCVEVGVWHRSTLEGAGAGKRSETALGGDFWAGAAYGTDVDLLFLVRDSKDPDGPMLTFSPCEWDAFLKGIKDGAFTDLG
ncbi:hypothetical protein GCM10017673_21180 [Streptosporangium violaceochromogenes]|nr:hypothetical protein GCM10017673_21180 [Streptosporangium violaceochromogenes]